MRIILSSALLFLIGCNSADKKEGTKVEGAYKMLSQNLKNDKTDSNITKIDQLKIFTGDHMMYANVNSPDSASGFGVGSYDITGDTLTEKVIYTSTDSLKDDTVRTYKLFIEKTAKGYRQIIPDIMEISDGQHYKLTEEYETAGAESKTPVDGLWKLTKAIAITGTDTIATALTHYKAIYGGHVIWGHTVTDSLGKHRTGVGFGRFEMTGNNKAKESIVASTYYQARGLSFDIDITMNGDDEFTQTLIEKDGTKGVETYQRVKK